jgi:glycosyltransferase involved in cell wall biosynthesis
MELSIVMPCLDEAETVGSCVDEARAFLEVHDVDGEVVVADNGSTDGSREIALQHGARVVEVSERGYGAALLTGIESARGEFIAIGDADSSYDFASLGPFLEKLRAGSDLVMGNRFAGGIEPGAMPFHHRYLGNPVLSFLGRLFFKTPVRDFHCGLRAFRKDSISRLGLRTTGMEFASEMVVKAALTGLAITEVPTPLRVDGRSRAPHLRSFRDGWRHLRFLLLYSPRWLFLYPGLLLLVVGLVSSAFLAVGPVTLASIRFDVATLLYANGASIIGFQAVLFAVLSRVYAHSAGLLPVSESTSFVERLVSPGRAALLGAVLATCGVVASLVSINYWRSKGFGDLDTASSIRAASPGVLGLTLGSQVGLGGLFLGILRIKTN